MTILVVVPTRGRREQCERLLASFEDTTDTADIAFVTDPDDQDTYAGMNWGRAGYGVLDPRASLTGKLNSVAKTAMNTHDALFFVGDDHVFRTPHWDSIFAGKITQMHGAAILYPDDKRRADVPEVWLMTSNIIRTLGWFAPPTQFHYYCDNIIAVLGKRTGLLRYIPEVVVEHLHYSVAPDTTRDTTYSYAEDTWGAADREACQVWYDEHADREACTLRREFNQDLRWVLSKV